MLQTCLGIVIGYKFIHLTLGCQQAARMLKWCMQKGVVACRWHNSPRCIIGELAWLQAVHAAADPYSSKAEQGCLSAEGTAQGKRHPYSHCL